MGAPQRACAQIVRVSAAATAVLAGLVLILFPVAASATLPGDNGKIAFARFASDGMYLATMDPDGSNQVVVSSNPLGPAGDTPVGLTFTEELGPSWSPNGAKLLFASNRASGGTLASYDLWSLNADGSGLERLTDTVDADEITPVWSPDGTRVAVALVDAAGDSDIWTMKPDGADARRLTRGEGFDVMPDWSPDGRTILFHRNMPPDWGASVYVIDATGAGAAADITRDLAPAGHPSWAPTGESIAFVSAQTGNEEIYVARADGSRARRLTWSSGPDYYPAWSPDGNRIAFVGTHAESTDIYSMKPDGDDQTRLTYGPFQGKYGHDTMPDWQRLKDSKGPRLTVRGIPTACTRRTFALRIAAWDVSGVQRVTVALDRGTLQRRGSRRFKVRVPAARLAPGRHRLRLVGVDAAGNRARATSGFRRCARR